MDTELDPDSESKIWGLTSFGVNFSDSAHLCTLCSDQNPYNFVYEVKVIRILVVTSVLCSL